MTTQRRSREQNRPSMEAKLTSSAGNLDAIMRRETARKQQQNGNLFSLPCDLVVIDNFAGSRQEELIALRNDQLREIRRNGSWVYAVNINNGTEGYIPASYCMSINRRSKDDSQIGKERPRSDGDHFVERQQSGNYFDPFDMTDTPSNGLEKVFSLADSTPFNKNNKGLLVVLYDFEGTRSFF